VALVPRKTLDLSRGARLRLALQDLGPIFIKFGQILSTRRDLLPEDIADELMLLQDRVPPFDSQLSVADRRAAGQENQRGVQPLRRRTAGLGLGGAGARRATENRRRSGGQGDPPGPEAGDRPGPGVAVHPRPRRRKISADARLLHPVDVVSDYEKTIYDELDLLREAANASQLRRNFEGSPLLYVPQVYWDWCRPKVLVMERIYGVPVTDWRPWPTSAPT
jgi:ubiquinone biosynthesis protein